MLDRLKALIGGAGMGRDAADGLEQDVRIAAAALLVEAAVMDGSFDDAEREIIRALLEDRYGLTTSEAEELVEDGRKAGEETHELYGFARAIKDHYDHEDRVRIIEMLWEVAYADGQLHDYEANLVRRIAGLIYVPDRDSGAARKRVLERLGRES